MKGSDVSAVLHALNLTDPAWASALADAVGSEPVPVETAMAHMESLALSRCKAYHLRKALSLPAASPPVLLSCHFSSLRLQLFGYDAGYEVPATSLAIDVSGRRIDVPWSVDPNADGPASLEFVVDDLIPGQQFSIKCRAVVSTALDSTLLWSGELVASTLTPPQPPRAPTVVTRTPNAVEVRVHGPPPQYHGASEIPLLRHELEVGTTIALLAANVVGTSPGIVSPTTRHAAPCVEGLQVARAGSSVTRVAVPISLVAASSSLYTLGDLSPGETVTLRSRWVVSDPLLQEALSWSQAVAVSSQRPPSAPSAPEVVTCHPTSLVLRLANPGAASDPLGSRIIIDCNGVQSVIEIVNPHEPQVDHTIVGLQEVTAYTVRHKVLVLDDAVDAEAAWSGAVTVSTPSQLDVTLAGLQASLVCAARPFSYGHATYIMT